MGEPYTRILIQHITDTHDVNVEVKDAPIRLRGAYTKYMGKYGIRDADVEIVGANNTQVIGSAVLSAITNEHRPDRLVLAVNCAPPDKDKHSKSAGNQRKDFYCAELQDGTIICGTLNGSELSYVRDQIKALYRLTNTNHTNSQFRSLDVLPEATLRFAVSEEREKMKAEGKLESADPAKEIPPPPGVTHTLRVDNFDNVGLHLSQTDRAALEKLAGRQIRVSFARAAIETGGRKARKFTPAFKATVKGAFFARDESPLTQLRKRFFRQYELTLNSSSRLPNGEGVPMVIDHRADPAGTHAGFKPPPVGAEVKIEVRDGWRWKRLTPALTA